MEKRTTYTTYTTPAQPTVHSSVTVVNQPAAVVQTQYTSSSPVAGRATSNVTVVHQNPPVVQHHVSFYDVIVLSCDVILM